MGLEFGPGSLAAALGLLGVGIPIIFPDNKWVGGLFIVAAVAIFFFDVRLTGWQLRGHSPTSVARQFALLGMITLGAGTLVCAAVFFWPSSSPSKGTQLSAQLFSDPQSQEDKRYVAWWGNTLTPVNILYGVFGTGKPPQKESLSIFLTNVGPGDIRRVRIKWQLHSEPIPKLIRDSGLFRSRITELDDNHLRFVVKRGQGENSGGWPFGLSEENGIPVIAAGRTEQVFLPKNVNTALWLSSMCISRTIEADALAYNRATARIASFDAKPMPRITALIDYEDQSGKPLEQHFEINGQIVFANGISDGQTGVGLTDPEGGAASIIHISVIPVPPA